MHSPARSTSCSAARRPQTATSSHGAPLPSSIRRFFPISALYTIPHAMGSGGGGYPRKRQFPHGVGLRVGRGALIRSSGVHQTCFERFPGRFGKSELFAIFRYLTPRVLPSAPLGPLGGRRAHVRPGNFRSPAVGSEPKGGPWGAQNGEKFKFSESTSEFSKHLWWTPGDHSRPPRPVWSPTTRGKGSF